MIFLGGMGAAAVLMVVNAALGQWWLAAACLGAAALLGLFVIKDIRGTW